MPEGSFLPFHCYIYCIDNEQYLIFGEHAISDEEAFQKMTLMSNEITNMARDLNQKNKELKEALAQVKTLSGLIPICMHCKGIRDDKGYWNKLENYISDHSDVQFSHGICDKCLNEHYPDDD